jgi:type I restriction enzyme S subunit
LKFLLRERDERSAAGLEQLLRVSQYTGVTPRRALREDGNPDTRARSLVGYKLVAVGDLAVNIMLAWNGSLGISRFDGIVSPAYCVYQFDSDVEPWYFHYLLRSPAFLSVVKGVSTGVVDSRLRLYTDDLYALPVLVPTRSEQSAIVRFLDHVDLRIRQYMAAQESLIKLLGEYREATITRGVTCGLNPDAPMKDSGVEWIADVPEHWEIRRLKDCLRAPLAYGVLKPDKYSGPDAVPILRIQDVVDGAVERTRLERISPQQDAEYSRTRVRPGDVVVSVVGTIGRAAVVPDDIGRANLSRALCRVQLNDRMSPAYFDLVSQSHAFLVQADSTPQGTAQRVLNLGDLRLFLVCVPPRPEQDTIAAALSQRTRAISLAMRSARMTIERMREYRSRLIADVVTGKVDVREAVAVLPEATGEREALDDIDARSDVEEADAGESDELGEEGAA